MKPEAIAIGALAKLFGNVTSDHPSELLAADVLPNCKSNPLGNVI